MTGGFKAGTRPFGVCRAPRLRPSTHRGRQPRRGSAVSHSLFPLPPPPSLLHFPLLPRIYPPPRAYPEDIATPWRRRHTYGKIRVHGCQRGRLPMGQPPPEPTPAPSPGLFRGLANHYRDLGPGGRATVIGAAIAAVATVAATAIPSLLSSTGDSGHEEQAQPAQSPSLTHSPSSSSAAMRPDRQCRSKAYVTEWISLRPCIARNERWLDAASEVRFHKAGTFTVFVWLKVESKVERTLKRCRFTITIPGEMEICGPHHFSPETPGEYSAATSVEEGTPATPKIWRNPNLNGIVSGSIPWKIP